MYKQCQSEQAAARQRQLEQGLLEAMLRQQYDEISVSELCDRMGVPRKAFYRYFTGKDGALYALIDHAIMDFDMYAGSAGAYGSAAPEVYIEKVFTFWVRNHKLLDALQRSGMSGILIQRAIAYTKQQNSLPSFLGNMDQTLRDYGTMFAVCGLMTMILQWHHSGFQPEVSKMSALALRLLREPLFTAPGQ